MSDPARVAVVTGGASGIGRAVAERFAAAGIHVVIADIHDQAAKDTAKAIEAGSPTPTTVVGIGVDVTSAASVRELVESTIQRMGRVDHLVNSAGMALSASTLTHEDADWHRVLDLNVSGTFYPCREFGSQLMATKGTIVNVSSIAAYLAVTPEIHVGYDATKGAIISFTRTLGVEWAPHGVRVNAVAPGYTNTEGLRSVGAESPETMAAWISQTPQRRLMEPADIAEVVLFLSSPESRAITAQTILADGGWSASK